MPLGSSTVPTY
ncbi:hypothetical protein pdam_00024575 [Pocillopora damicornis]|uniref:Uncharacterized protein n=1 Tax=Pocillopora damicornis TaxID=46731 RepID=A0A3M6U9J5_POCDA|nr:hypothetical protein pdam_00024575 [Pocillopora damicornis]